MTRRVRSALLRGLLAGNLCLATLPGCAVFGGPTPSTVAQGKYYSSGDPRYDEFFIALYSMQVAMADAPRVPEAEQRALAKALSLSPEADIPAIGERLHEEAQKLSRAGVHLRLDRNPAKDRLDRASVSLRSTARPKDDPSAALLTQVEQSATNLARSIDDTTRAEETLGKLEPNAENLDAGAEAAFASTHFGKLGEVKKNLADARQLIALMHARATNVRHASETLLLQLSQAIDTDDGSLGPPPLAAGAEPPVDAPKKPAPKAHPKTRPSGASNAPAARPKPAPDSDAPSPPPKPSKPPPAPRDFEP
ncbi:MAG: hypothetical protein ABW061_25685 [Polyangiaceae bacterium]